MRKNRQIYGIAFHSPLIIYNLVSPKRHFPVLLMNPQPGRVKEDYENQIKQNVSGKTPVILACSLEILKTFFGQNPKLTKFKTILFDLPGLMLPFFGPLIVWLDCDHQAGGAWQIAKLKPEDFNDLLDELQEIDETGRDFVDSMERCRSKDRIHEIQQFADKLPKSYKELLASIPDEDQSPLKGLKESRRNRDSLNATLSELIKSIEPMDARERLVRVVLDYQVNLLPKRDFLTRLGEVISDDHVKKEFLAIRKWIDSKAGAVLQDAYFDYALNSERRAWSTIVSSYKKLAEEDLLLLVSYRNPKVQSCIPPEDRVGLYKELPGDKLQPTAPNHPTLYKLGDLFNY